METYKRLFIASTSINRDNESDIFLWEQPGAAKGGIMDSIDDSLGSDLN